MKRQRTIPGLLLLILLPCWLGAPALADQAAAPGRQATVRHDPFSRPALGAAAASAGDPAAPGGAVLKGVLTNGTLRLANIDGRIVAAGDEIYGYRVLVISDRAVIMKRGDDTLSLNLKQPNGVDPADGDPD